MFCVILDVNNPVGELQEVLNNVVKLGPPIQLDQLPLVHFTRNCQLYKVELLSPVMVFELVVDVAVLQLDILLGLYLHSYEEYPDTLSRLSLALLDVRLVTLGI